MVPLYSSFLRLPDDLFLPLKDQSFSWWLGPRKQECPYVLPVRFVDDEHLGLPCHSWVTPTPAWTVTHVWTEFVRGETVYGRCKGGDRCSRMTQEVPLRPCLLRTVVRSRSSVLGHQSRGVFKILKILIPDPTFGTENTGNFIYLCL